MEWKEIDPEQEDWERQIKLNACNGEVNLGSIVFGIADDGWQTLIDGSLEYMQAETEEEAKEEMKAVLCDLFEREIENFKNLLKLLENLE